MIESKIWRGRRGVFEFDFKIKGSFRGQSAYRIFVKGVHKVGIFRRNIRGQSTSSGDRRTSRNWGRSRIRDRNWRQDSRAENGSEFRNRSKVQKFPIDI